MLCSNDEALVSLEACFQVCLKGIFLRQQEAVLLQLAATSDVKFMQLAPNDLTKNLKKALNNTYITTQWLKRTIVFTTLTARNKTVHRQRRRRRSQVKVDFKTNVIFSSFTSTFL